MQYPNAYQGVSKIFLAEILTLIGTVIVAFGTVLAFGGAAAAYEGSMELGGGLVIGGLVSMVGGVVLPIVGLILQLIGLNQASKDEPKNFKIAFYGAIVALIASLVSGFFVGGGWVYSLLTLVAGVANILVFAYTIGGIMELARQLNRPEMVSLGNKILWMVVIAYVISFVVKILPFAELAAVLLIVSGILALVSYIVFLVYLSKAKKMLAA